MNQDKVAEPPLERFNRKLFGLGLSLTLMIFLISGLVFVFYLKNSITKKVSPIQLTVETASPPSAPVFDKSEWFLEVLNGSGISGAAKKSAEKLAGAGFKVIKIGNADKSNYPQTEVFIAKNHLDQTALLMKELDQVLNEATFSGELKDSTASAKIIIGKGL